MKQIKVPANLTELAYLNIRESILTGEQLPGERLSEERLALQLGISKSPIREALNRLEIEGLVQVLARVGTRVVQFDADEINQLFELREALETLAIKLLRPTPEFIVALGGIVKSCDQHVANKDLSKFMKEDSRFHATLISGSQNPFLIRVFRNLQDQVALVRTRSIQLPGRPARSHEEHKKIVRALQEGDRQLLEQLLREHIRAVRIDVVKSLEDAAPAAVSVAGRKIR